MRKFTRTCFVAAALFASSLPAIAQTDSKDLYDMSLEELMSVSIVSASKTKERLFDAPVAVYSVTRDEISRAGVMSIPEALRLIPGVVVREINNGNYDVHLRGFDNTAQYTYSHNQGNTITLVMINNRPVFNYNSGGTIWESLPVDIADIDRIEVVCGPSAPLFGPNAVSGVVNIITREFKDEKLLVSGQLQSSMPGGSQISSIAIGRRSGNLSVGVTGNYQHRIRLDDEQYQYNFGGAGGYYVKSEEFRRDRVDKIGLDYKQSLRRIGYNVYASYSPSEHVQLDYSTGIQGSQAQKVNFTSTTPTTYAEANSFYSNLNSKIYDLSLRMSYVMGNDELHKLSEYYTTAYDYSIADLTADYDIKVGDKLQIRPSLGYQFSKYSDLDRIKEGDFLGGLINAEKTMKNISGSLRTDYTPVNDLRLVASGRLDKFDVNDDVYLSYQFASTYAFNEKLMVRAVHGKSYSGIFYNSAFLDSKIFTSESSVYYAMGNPDIKATSNTLSEIGLRGNLLSNLKLDVTLFSQKLENVSLLTYVGTQNYRTSQFPNGLRIDYHQADNLLYTTHQNGATVSLNWMPNKQWQIRPFVTVQQTESRNFDYYNHPRQSNVPYTGKTVKHESTPSFFGGWYVNYSPISKLNINTSAYILGDQKIYHQNDLSFENNEGDIASKMLINAKVNYMVYDKLGLFLGGKNMLNKNTREFYGTDRMGSQYFAGISYNL